MNCNKSKIEAIKENAMKQLSTAEKLAWNYWDIRSEEIPITNDFQAIEIYRAYKAGYEKGVIGGKSKEGLHKKVLPYKQRTIKASSDISRENE